MIADLHRTLAWVVVGSEAVVGAWALAAHWQPTLRVRTLLVVGAAVQVVLFVQVALGVAALDGVEGEPADFHIFYGFVALATVGIVYSYDKSYRRQLEQWRFLLFGGTGLFLMGLCLRAMQFA